MTRVPILLVFFLILPASAQTALELATKPAAPHYEWITFLAAAPFGYEEEADVPFRYRAVVETFEIYDYLYLEKLAIGNSEGVSDSVAWSLRLGLDRLLGELGYLSEEQVVGEVEWTSAVTLVFKLAGTRLRIPDVTAEELKVEEVEAGE